MSILYSTSKGARLDTRILTYKIANGRLAHDDSGARTLAPLTLRQARAAYLSDFCGGVRCCKTFRVYYDRNSGETRLRLGLKKEAKTMSSLIKKNLKHKIKQTFKIPPRGLIEVKWPIIAGPKMGLGGGPCFYSWCLRWPRQSQRLSSLPPSPPSSPLPSPRPLSVKPYRG